MIYKTLHRKLKIEQHESHHKPGMNSDAPEEIIMFLLHMWHPIDRRKYYPWHDSIQEANKTPATTMKSPIYLVVLVIWSSRMECSYLETMSLIKRYSLLIEASRRLRSDFAVCKQHIHKRTLLVRQRSVGRCQCLRVLFFQLHVDMITLNTLHIVR